MMSRSVRAAIAAILALPVIGIAQAPPNAPPASQAPARDTSTTRPAPAVSLIRGRVLSVDTGRGIRGATVRATAAGLPARSALTDAEGRYEFKELPAGRYVLSASKLTFITLEHGQTRPFEAGKPLELAEKQTLENVDFHLPLGGVIAGRVVDDVGEPVVNYTVRPFRMRYVQGRRELVPIAAGVPTDDVGEYRIYGLSPGEYYVAATLRLTLSSDAAGSGFAPTYYPSVTNLAEAQRISVALGKTMTSVDIALAPVKTATVTGRAVDVEGRPLSRGTLNMSLRAPAPTEGIGGASLRPDGTFTLSNIPPGDYNLDLDGTGSSPGLQALPTLRATTRVLVNGADLNNVVLALTRVAAGSGRLVLPAGASLSSPSSVRLTTSFIDPNDARFFNDVTIVKDDLTFELPAPPGQLIVRPSALPQGWALKEVRHGGRNVTDSGISFAAGQKVGGIEVELTNRPPVVSGAVRNAKGEPAGDYTVVFFSQSPERRNGNPRYVAVARPDQLRSFRVTTLAPGDYCAIALEYADPAEVIDPEVLSRLEGRAVRFSIQEGETQNLELTVSDQ